MLILAVIGCNKEPSPPLSPAMEYATFEVAPGYDVALVAAEPMIQDPVVIKFDEDGRMWVVEMRGFMPDIDGTGEDLPVGRINVLTDTNQDGEMDKSIIFADSLVLPRAVAIVEGGALVVEDEVLWFMEDSNGDLKADKRLMIDSEYGNKGVVEHSANGLWRGMDNWYYSAKSRYRYRLVDHQWIKQETEFRGQWGICHDNIGRLYYNYNWSQLHMDLVPPNYLTRNPNHQSTNGIDYSISQDRRVYPIRSNLAINRGYVEGTLDEKGRIIEFASASAPFVYRGDLYESNMVGNVFVCEPTGNLVKRNLVLQDGFYPMAENAYSNKEFLASTDERFRPVWLESGPDGALYIADMYRGIIQHGPYMSPYLREVTLERKLDQHINLGRVWRVIPEGDGVRKPVHQLSTFSTKMLVDLLGHPNGWYRDMAQRLLVEKAEAGTVDLLIEVIKNSTNQLAQLHALWTLEGINYQAPGIYLQAMKSGNVPLQTASIRILENLAMQDANLLKQFEEAILQPYAEGLSLQVVLSAAILEPSVKYDLLLAILNKHQESEVFRDAVMSSIANQEFEFLMKIVNDPSWINYRVEKEIIIELLSTAIATKRDSTELRVLIDYIDVSQLEWKHNAIIAGLSFHKTSEIDEAIMLEQIPEIFKRKLSKELGLKIDRIFSLYNWPGKDSEILPKKEMIIEPVDPEVFSLGRNLYLSICSNCHGNDGKGLARFGPPLAASEWVLGAPERLIRILLHGMEGPVEVNGKIYDKPDILPVMPAFATTPAEEIAAVLTYIRQEWGNQASAIESRTVASTRVTTQGKVNPWKATELLQLETDQP